MAAPVDTNVGGEGAENNVTGIESWMSKNEYTLSRDTYDKLTSAGFTTMYVIFTTFTS